MRAGGDQKAQKEETMTFHSGRKYGHPPEIYEGDAGLRTVAQKIVNHTWTLCSAFLWRDGDLTMAFLNDSTNEDAIQEYAIVRVDRLYETQLMGQQFESFTVGWMDPERFFEAVKATAERIRDGSKAPFGHVDHWLHLSDDYCEACR